MSKFLKGFVVAAALVVVAAMGIGVIVREGSAIDGESRAFAEAAIPAITSTWDPQALLDRASPTLTAMTTPAQLADAFSKLSSFGPIVSVEAPKGQALMMLGTTGTSETASYVAKVKYQNADAVVKLVLVKLDGRWMINFFRIEPTTRLTASRA